MTSVGPIAFAVGVPGAVGACVSADAATSSRDESGVAAEIPRGVRRSHAISISRARRHPVSAIGRPARRRNLREGRTPRSRAALHPVARHSNVVRRGRPAQIDLAAADDGDNWCTWHLSLRLAIQNHGGRRRADVGVTAEIIGGVSCSYPIAVGCRGTQTGVAVRRRSVVVAICAKLLQPAPTTALDQVPRNPDVIGSRSPEQIDLARRDRT